MKNITISPVSRIEGHAQVTISLDDKGEVANDHFHATELRGFEKFLEGAAIEEAPHITPRHLRHLPDGAQSRVRQSGGRYLRGVHTADGLQPP
jgi:hypothetical protein